jgi:deoxyadenosine/deoxycytidine kinase
MIVIGGMIGLGKTSCAKILGEALGSQVFYEKVENNRVLEKFYTASEEEIQAKRYPFLLQLEFLGSRFKSIKEAQSHPNNILDRSLWEDKYFKDVNCKLGRISQLESDLYDDLLEEMLKEIDGMPKKAPELMVYLKASFDTVLERIKKRGRGYELDDALKEYYYNLWKGYDDWVQHCYKASPIIVIDMDTTDVVNNPKDAQRLVQLVTDKLKEMRKEK